MKDILKENVLPIVFVWHQTRTDDVYANELRRYLNIN